MMTNNNNNNNDLKDRVSYRYLAYHSMGFCSIDLQEAFQILSELCTIMTQRNCGLIGRNDMTPAFYV